jgi:protein disulfide-isomerase
MKQFLAALALLLATSAAFAAEAEWITDVHTALSRAPVENKLILLDFTGSDWCGWCKKLKAEVFDQPEFIEYAKTHLILVEVDFPHAKQLSADQQAANKQLATTYKIQGYPTIILLDSHGNKVGETGYQAGGPKNYIAHLESITGQKPSDRAEKPSEPEAPRHVPPAFVPIAPAKPNYYAALALKGISGAKDSRMALINNETFMVGDTAKVRVRDTKIEVTCKEIREDSVLLLIDGKPQELKLASH